MIHIKFKNTLMIYTNLSIMGQKLTSSRIHQMIVLIISTASLLIIKFWKKFLQHMNPKMLIIESS